MAYRNAEAAAKFKEMRDLRKEAADIMDAVHLNQGLDQQCKEVFINLLKKFPAFASEATETPK